MITGRGGKNKIRPPRRSGLHGGSPANSFEALWTQLRSALVEIHTRNASTLSFEHLYRASYKIVLKKDGDSLYDRVRQFEEQWFAAEVMPIIQKLITNNLLLLAQGAGSTIAANERRRLGEKFLDGLVKAWTDHQLSMSMTTDVLMYMDRVYCGDNRKASIFTTAMGLFRDHVLRSNLSEAAEVQIVTFDILNSVILDQIRMEREGDVIKKSLVRSVCYMLEALYENDEEAESDKLYLTTFEPAFLHSSTDFYKAECQKLLQDGDAGSWLKQTQKRLSEEADRCATTISVLTENKILKVVEAELISAHFEDFLALEGSGVKSMIENDRHEELKLLYQHISRVDPAKDALKNALQSRIMNMGAEVNKTILNTDFSAAQPVKGGAGDANSGEASDKAKPQSLTAAAQQTAAAIKWVDEVLQLKEKFDAMMEKCFAQDQPIGSAITKSFSDFVNLFPRCSEYVSLFIDDNLKRGIKGKSEAEIDVVLDKAVTLLRYISDKDLFERYYKKHLARRLLLGKSESTDVEKQMISRMKMEVGNYFTNKLEGMFKDMTMSEELTAGYREHIQQLGDVDRKRIDLGINVLTTNFWPVEAMGGVGYRDEKNEVAQCLWPPEIKILMDSFTKYYLKERNGRQLTWLGFTGTADIRCIFPKIPGKDGILGRERRHEIQVTTYGMLIMLLFNNLAPGASMTFEEIQAETKIPTQDLVRQLTTLAVLPKARVLVKEPANKTVKPGDKFFFNENFTSKAVKIKAPSISAVNKVEDEGERKGTQSRNDEMRGGVIEACVVRIMKQRKVLSHANLTTEVLSVLAGRFSPQVAMVKKRIESLMEREYIERVEDAEVPTYRYLA